MSIAGATAVAVIRAYQRSTPGVTGRTCRYTPSCSEYAVRSIQKHGLVVGAYRAVKRIRRCTPPFGGRDEP